MLPPPSLQRGNSVYSLWQTTTISAVKSTSGSSAVLFQHKQMGAHVFCAAAVVPAHTASVRATVWARAGDNLVEEEQCVSFISYFWGTQLATEIHPQEQKACLTESHVMTLHLHFSLLLCATRRFVDALSTELRIYEDTVVCLSWYGFRRSLSLLYNELWEVIAS